MPSVTKTNPENCKNCYSKCTYDCAELQYTIQHTTVLCFLESFCHNNSVLLWFEDTTLKSSFVFCGNGVYTTLVMQLS